MSFQMNLKLPGIRQKRASEEDRGVELQVEIREIRGLGRDSRSGWLA